MQIGQAQVVRSNWYDRTPTFISKIINVLAGTHANTSRWSYTVPANRAAKLGALMMHVQFEGVGDADGDNSNCVLEYTPSGGGVTTLFNLKTVAFIDSTHNVLDVSDLGLLQAGDKLEFFTYATMIGAGLFTFTAGLTATEYDA